MNQDIRHIDISHDNSSFLAAEFENKVYLYQTDEPTPLKEFNTHLDFGGQRLKLLPDMNSFVVGAYNRFGLSAISLSTSMIIWERRDLKKVQKIIYGSNNNSLYTVFANKPTLELNSSDGIELLKLKGVKDIFKSEYTNIELMVRTGKYEVFNDGNLLFTVKPSSFAILDVGFSNSTIAISESGASLRIFNLSGEQIGHLFRDGYHFIQLSYDFSKQIYVGLFWGYQSNGRYFLITFSETGTIKSEIEITDGYAGAFLIHRNTFLNAKGNEINYLNGKTILKYKF